MRSNRSSYHQAVEPSPAIDYLVGFLAALFLVVGRWTPDRLLPSLNYSPFIEVRLWVAALMLMVLILSGLTVLKPIPTDARPAVGTVVGLSIVYFVYMILTTFWARDTSLALGKVYEMALTLIVVVALARRIRQTGGERVRNAFWVSLIVLAGGLAILAVFSIVTGSSLQRISVLGGGPNAFGRMMGLLCFGSLLMWRRGGPIWLWIPAAALSFLLVILSGSRGAAVAWGVSIAVYLLFSRTRITTKLVTLIAGTIVVTLVVWYTPLGRTITDVFESRFVQLSLEQGYDSGRSNIYQDALELGMENPVFGLGLNAFQARGLGSYPHNLFLESFSEGGIVGVALMVGLICIVTFQLWAHRHAIDSITVSAFVLTVIFSQFNGDLFDSRAVFMFMILTFVTIAQPDLRAATSPPSSLVVKADHGILPEQLSRD